MTLFVYTLLSALFAAVTPICNKFLSSGTSAPAAILARTMVALVFSSGSFMVQPEAFDMAMFSKRTMLIIILSEIAMGFSWIFYFKALKIGKASLVAAVEPATCVFTVVLAAIFLGEMVSWKSGLGCLLVGCGTLLLILDK